MDNQFQKAINLTYLGCAALVSFIFWSLAIKLSGAYDVESKFKSIELVIHVVSVASGIGMFFVLSKTDKVNLFLSEVYTELLTKVTWPAQKETSYATIVVLVTVLIAGVLLAILDWFFGWTVTIGVPSIVKAIFKAF